MASPFEDVCFVDLPLHFEPANGSSQRVLGLRLVVNVQIWEMVGKLPLSASIPFESIDEDYHH